MKRLLAGLCAAALLISLTQSAEPFGMGREGRGFGRLGAQNKKGTGGGGGGGTNFVLRTDGSRVLRTDSSRICRSGGC